MSWDVVSRNCCAAVSVRVAWLLLSSTSRKSTLVSAIPRQTACARGDASLTAVDAGDTYLLH